MTIKTSIVTSRNKDLVLRRLKKSKSCYRKLFDVRWDDLLPYKLYLMIDYYPIWIEVIDKVLSTDSINILILDKLDPHINVITDSDDDKLKLVRGELYEFLSTSNNPNLLEERFVKDSYTTLSLVNHLSNEDLCMIEYELLCR